VNRGEHDDRDDDGGYRRHHRHQAAHQLFTSCVAHMIWLLSEAFCSFPAGQLQNGEADPCAASREWRSAGQGPEETWSDV
jgi:hypothetical protein